MIKKYIVNLKGHNFNSHRATVKAKEIRHSEETTPYEMMWGQPTLSIIDVNLDAFEDSEEETMAAIQTAMSLAIDEFEFAKCPIWA